MMALHGGAGILGAPLVGIAACGMTLAIGQTAFAMTRSVIIRAIIAALFAVPATLAGYQVVFATSQIGVPSLVWREIFACLGAVSIGGTTWVRLTVFTETRPLDSDRAFWERSSTGSHYRSPSEVILHHPLRRTSWLNRSAATDPRA